MRSSLAALVIGLLVTGVSACAGTLQSSEESPSDVLTREQLYDVNAHNAYDGVEKLRPRWLSSRGPTSFSDSTPTSVSVYVSGTRMGSADFLRGIQAAEVELLRYFNSREASARFGMDNPLGVIHVTLR